MSVSIGVGGFLATSSSVIRSLDSDSALSLSGFVIALMLMGIAFFSFKYHTYSTIVLQLMTSGWLG